MSETGVQLREVNGKRSSQLAGKQVFSSSVRFVDADLADRIESTSNWRKTYVEAVARIIESGARSPKNALRIAEDGLEALEKSVVFSTSEGDIALRDALSDAKATFGTETVDGTGSRETELQLPYRGQVLRGDGLKRQLDSWVQQGVIEPSAASALGLVIDHPEWIDMTGEHVAILGAASEMGPMGPVSRWGAEVLAIDLPRKHLWDRIIQLGSAGAGRLYAPVPDGAADRERANRAGADLLTDTPAIAAWLQSFDRPLVIADRVYADGARFVQLAASIGALVDELHGARQLAALSYLATPTDAYAVPSDIVDRALSKRPSAAGRAAATLLKGVSAKRLYAPNYSRRVVSDDGRSWGISDCIVPQQGANYILAKNAQRWRATTSKQRGLVVSSNVAPPTQTHSVTKNKVLATAYRGAGTFGVEVFAPETASVLMAALLVHDLRNPSAAGKPEVSLSHPYELFVNAASHGGIWSLAHEPRSILPLAVLTGSLKRR